MNRSIGGALALVAAGFVTSAAQAQEIDYGYFEIGYTQSEFDDPGGDLEANGPKFEFSYSLRDHVHGFASYEKSEFDDAEVEGSRRVAGFGTHFDVLETLGTYGRFGIINADVSLLGTPASDDGVFIAGGVRYRPREGFEIRGGFEHVDFDDSGSDTNAFFGADLYLSDIAVLAFGARDEDGGDTLSVGLRFYFRQDDNGRR